MQLGKGSLAGYDLPGLAKAAAKIPLDGWNFAAPMATDMNEASVEAKVEEGIVRFANGVIKGPGSTLSFSGEVDLLRQALAVKLASGVTISGPWANPHFAPQQ